MYCLCLDFGIQFQIPVSHCRNIVIQGSFATVFGRIAIERWIVAKLCDGIGKGLSIVVRHKDAGSADYVMKSGNEIGRASCRERVSFMV